MGIMCGLATEHELAYDMYEHSAEEFLLAQDTIAYFYALNDMAFELAEAKKKDEAFAILNYLEDAISDSTQLHYIQLIKAVALRNVHEFDSAIYYADKILASPELSPTGYIVKAQSFSFLNIKDSAVYYARRTIAEPNASPQDQYNALYIICNNDSTLSKDSILTLNAQRADIMVYSISPEKGEMMVAVEYLQKYLHHSPDLRWLLAIFFTVISIGMPSILYVSRKRKKHQLVSQQTEILKRQQEALSKHNQKLEKEQSEHTQRVFAEIEVFCNSITKENIKQELCWRDFDKMCTIVNRRMYGLVDKLRARGITSMTEIRICVLLALDRFNAKQMANVIPCTYDSFKTTKSLIVKKLNVSRENIHSYLINLAVGG